MHLVYGRIGQRPEVAAMDRAQRLVSLMQSLKERILLLDGAMGTMIQSRGLDEDHYRGDRFRDWESDLKGNNDLLTLTQPSVIEDIHRQFLDAGADIIETNTFNSNAPSMSDYGLENLVPELNLVAARLARECADAHAAQVGSPRYVAGVLGPTNRTASISPDVNDPGFRNIRFAELVVTYEESAHALIKGGVDFLIRHQTQLCQIRHHAAGHDLRHHHRRFGTHFIRADERGILERH
jgi:5-methyltetrahydrofolate--homocysteine methyltransferase